MDAPDPSSMLRYEEEAWARGTRWVAGVDEAGRGPLAGPVVAAAVTGEAGFLRDAAGGIFDGLTDSKKLTAGRRDAFFERLTETPEIRQAVAVVEPGTIDRINILRATHQAMAEALAALAQPPELALIDGRPVPGLAVASRALVQGDRMSLLIAAASVLAKVTRDRLMDELHERYPAYGFARHRGYGTPEHLEALRRYGPTPVHRRSFRPVAEQWLAF